MNMKLPANFSIFPVSGKKPLVNWAQYSKRLPDADERAQFDATQKTGYGIATGPVSGIIVLDDDGGLDINKYPIPKTWTVNTPRGGKHYYFKWISALDTKVTTKTEILEKVDIRGQGGFVVFYGWERPYYLQTLAIPPQWLIDLLPSKNTQFTNTSTTNNIEKSKLQELLDDIKPGNRNDSFTRAAGSLRYHGYSAADIFGILNAKAREVGFRDTELKTICDSVCRYDSKIKVDEPNASHINEFLKEQEKVEWLVPGLIARKSIGFVVGLPETGKTWMLIDLAVECAKGGGLWLGKMPVEKARVLFIDQERFKGETQRRFKAVIGAKNSGVMDLSLYIKTGTTTRLDLQHSFDAFRRELSELKPDLVIVDSFVTFHTREENNRKDIQEVLERVKELRQEFGCTFLFIHHENKLAFDKDQGEPSISQMAGSIAIPAVAETVLTVRRHDSEGSMVYHTKSTLAPTVPPFMVRTVDLDEAKTRIKVEAY